MPATIPADKLAAIETAYVTGDESYRQLAARYGISRGYLAMLGHDNGWVDKRKQYRAGVVSKAIGKRARVESDRLARLMTASDKAAEHIEQLFDDPQQFNRHIVQVTDETGATVPMEQIYDKRDSLALRSAVSALKELTAVIRDLYRLPTLREEQAQEIAVQRLELDRQRQQTQDVRDTSITVRFEGLDDDGNNTET